VTRTTTRGIYPLCHRSSYKLYTSLYTCGYIYYYTVWDKRYRKNLDWKKTVMLEMSRKCLVFSDPIRYTYYLILSWLRCH